MVKFAGKMGLALVAAMLCCDGSVARAQTAPMTYWGPGWPFGLGGNPTDWRSATSGNFPDVDGRDVQGTTVQGARFAYTHFNALNGAFGGGAGRGMGWNATIDTRNGAFDNFPSLAYDGVQASYSFGNKSGLPVTVFAGVDALKFNPGLGPGLSAFDTTSATLGYRANAGIEFRPTSNLSLSLGVGYTEQSKRGGFNSLSLSGN